MICFFLCIASIDFFIIFIFSHVYCNSFLSSFSFSSNSSGASSSSLSGAAQSGSSSSFKSIKFSSLLLLLLLLIDALGDFISNFLCEGVEIGIVGGEGQGDERGGGNI